MDTKVNLQKATKEVRNAYKRSIIRMYENGRNCPYISKELGIQIGFVYKLTCDYKKIGIRVFIEKKRGRKHGTHRKLTPAQEKAIQKAIIDKTPDQMKMKFALWNANAVKLYIMRTFNIELPARTIRHYLQSWGFTPQKPLKKAYEQNPEKVREWLENEYPKIKAEAKAENAQIFWGDETSISAKEHNARGYSPKGKTPIIRLTANKGIRISMISAISNQGHLNYMMYKCPMNVALFIVFLERLIKSADGRRVYLIVDNLKVHHAKLLQPWLEEHTSQLKLYHLPSYSPELNPDEYLNNDLKIALNKGEPARGTDHLEEKADAHLRKRQSQPDVVANFYKHPKVAYAAA